MDGRSARPFARQNRGDVTLRDSQLSLTCYACLPFFSPVSCVGSYGSVMNSFSKTNPRVRKRRVPCSRERATEHTPESVN
eukprot:6179767-Pleurochrysis_carterae.AAC.1